MIKTVIGAIGRVKRVIGRCGRKRLQSECYWPTSRLGRFNSPKHPILPDSAALEAPSTLLTLLFHNPIESFIQSLKLRVALRPPHRSQASHLLRRDAPRRWFDVNKWREHHQYLSKNFSLCRLPFSFYLEYATMLSKMDLDMRKNFPFSELHFRKII